MNATPHSSDKIKLIEEFFTGSWHLDDREFVAVFKSEKKRTGTTVHSWCSRLILESREERWAKHADAPWISRPT
jgi:hypothetical protein